MKKCVVVIGMATTLIIPPAVATAGIAGPAAAASGVTCGKFKAKAGEDGGVAISRCMPKNNSFKTLSSSSSSFVELGTSTLTWSPGGQTTTINVTSLTELRPGGCRLHYEEVDLTGSVTADTSGYVQVGDPVSARLCEEIRNATYRVVKGTTVDL
jgi:hypothetical protein